MTYTLFQNGDCRKNNSSTSSRIQVTAITATTPNRVRDITKFLSEVILSINLILGLDSGIYFFLHQIAKED
jgi:hypothetical protein